MSLPCEKGCEYFCNTVYVTCAMKSWLLGFRSGDIYVMAFLVITRFTVFLHNFTFEQTTNLRSAESPAFLWPSEHSWMFRKVIFSNGLGIFFLSTNCHGNKCNKKEKADRMQKPYLMSWHSVSTKWKILGHHDFSLWRQRLGCEEH